MTRALLLQTRGLGAWQTVTALPEGNPPRRLVNVRLHSDGEREDVIEYECRAGVSVITINGDPAARLFDGNGFELTLRTPRMRSFRRCRFYQTTVDPH